jgi:hypothetical protein
MGLDLAVDRRRRPVHTACAREGIEVISAPEDKPWDVREMHVRHPDGHILRSARRPRMSTGSRMRVAE